jgi:hypothetical protein
VLRIVTDCRDCGEGDEKIIKVNNHIQEERVEQLIKHMSTYEWNDRGGSVQADSSILNIKHNGTVGQVVKMPFTKSQYCVDLTVGSHGNINTF